MRSNLRSRCREVSDERIDIHRPPRRGRRGRPLWMIEAIVGFRKSGSNAGRNTEDDNRRYGGERSSTSSRLHVNYNWYSVRCCASLFVLFLPPSTVFHIQHFLLCFFMFVSRFFLKRKRNVYIYIINYGTPLTLTDDYSLWWYARWWYSFDIIRLTWKK